MTPAAFAVLALGLVLGLALAKLVPRLVVRLRKKKPQGLPYLTEDEIREADRKLRMLIGEDPDPIPKRPRRRPARRSEDENGEPSS